MWRRSLSLGFSSTQSSTVCGHPPRLRIHPSVFTLFACFVPGTLAVLFFQCMTALLSPVCRKGESIKWGLVTYTALMFSIATVYTAMNFNIQSTSFLDNREFSVALPNGRRLLVGPILYQTTIRRTALGGLVPNIMFSLNNWLADGLLVSFSVFTSRPHSSGCLTSAPPSSIVVTYYSPRTSGSSFCPSSCTLPLWVRI